MKKYLILLVVALFFTAANAFDKGEWTGFITDDKCGAKGNNKGHAACAKDCVKKGAKIVFHGEPYFWGNGHFLEGALFNGKKLGGSSKTKP